MSTHIIDQLPDPPEYFTEAEIQIWEEYGSNLISKGVLRQYHMKDLENLVFWESHKRTTLLNLNGEFTSKQLTLLKGGRLKLHSSILLSNYTAIQDEINELRFEFGLHAESPQYISNTPVIPDEAYRNLPEMLRDCCAGIDNSRKKDTFLLYSLPVLAFHLDNVLFEHSEGVFSPTIKTIVLNTHGTIQSFARKTLDLASILEKQSMGSENQLNDPIVSSSADLESVKKIVVANHGKAMLFDERYKGNRSGKDHHSQLFRNLIAGSFNEKEVNLSKNDDETMIVTPKICMSQCASVDELKEIVELYGEDILNYFLFYLYDQSPDWESARPTRESHQFLHDINRFSEEMYRLYTLCMKREHPLMVDLTDSQWQMIDDTFREKVSIIEELGLMQQLNGMLLNSSVYVVKIAVLFRMIRSINQEADLKNIETIKAQDEDVVASLWIIDTLLKHSIRIYQNLPVMKENVRGDRYYRFYDILPVVFDTSQALEVASKISIPARTANRYLSTYLESNYLSKLRKGVYYKREM